MNLRTLIANLRQLRPVPVHVEELARASTDACGLVNRRSFLGLAGAALAGLAIDPERLIWTPGEQRVFIPDLRIPDLLPLGLGGNTFATPGWVMKKVARQLTNNVEFAKRLVRQYDDGLIGPRLDVKLPTRYQGRLHG